MNRRRAFIKSCLATGAVAAVGVSEVKAWAEERVALRVHHVTDVKEGSRW